MLYLSLSVVGFVVAASMSSAQQSPVLLAVGWALIVFALAVGLYRARKPWLAVGLLAGYALAGLLTGGMCIFLPQSL